MAHRKTASNPVGYSRPGFCQTKPVAPNTTEEGRAQNRRTEFHVAELFDKKGKASKYLGGDPLGGGKEFN